MASHCPSRTGSKALTWLRVILGVRVHLAAADLVFGEHDFVAEALEQGHGGLRCLGEHDVC